MSAWILLAVAFQGRPEPDWLPVLDAPPNLSHRLILPTPRHAGSTLVVRGKVFKEDGVTPAAGVTIYIHHTDARGLYAPPPRATGWERFHGAIRGWLKTNASGEYELRTTRPAPYPNGTEPAHIHAYGLLPGSRTGFYFDDILFEGDPLINQAHWQRVARFGTRPYRGMRTTVDHDGVQQGQWNFVIPRRALR